MSCSLNCSGAITVPPESGPELSNRPSAVWSGAAERLDRVLPELGLARSRSQASELILAGHVSLNGVIAAKAGVRVVSGSRIELAGGDHYVSRAAHKLIAALDVFAVDPEGKVALDLGASTGGFTQVLLERGALCVQAIDVGHGQLVEELRDNERVRAVEGCNARDLTPEGLVAATGIADLPELIVADLSFISLTLILPAIARVAAENVDVILLIKPQFEVGRVRDGIVTDPSLRAEAIRTVLRSACECGFGANALEISPVRGTHGNYEYLGRFTRGGGANPTEWEERIMELTGQQRETAAVPATNGAA
jgi:23S rRNA (cytidine1920-2'-O)/16S rRNA (cytidine1409-2'-O)-methyltransferase